jgi:pimeloyl-ACP methyl ester carboxylesterase
VRVEEHTTTIDHVPVFYRSAGIGSVVYLHDAITSSDDWLPFLVRSGGLAPDLIGFGRSGKGGHLDYTPEGLSDFVLRLLTELEAERAQERVQLVGHGWGGALALLVALREPRRVERIVLIDAVPLLPGFSWQGPARLWRRSVIGELVMGSTSRRQLRKQLRKGSASWTDERLDAVWEQFDQGTQRALLRLHRAADEARLAELGGKLGSLDVGALVIWGERDPWFAPDFADAYGATLPRAAVARFPDAGHWPWLDEPQVIDRVVEFVT